MIRNPPIYVINLDRSAGRMSRIKAELEKSGLGCIRVPAVDAEKLPALPPEYDAEANRCRYLAPLSAGEIGCVLSHRKAWRLIADDQRHAAAVVLEDDASLAGRPEDLARVLPVIGNSPRPELVKLYNLRNTPRKPATNYRNRFSLMPPLTTTAQALNRAAAEALLRFTETFYEPADVIIQRWWDHGVRVRTMSPAIFFEVGHENDSTIRIRGARPAEGRLMRELRRPLFQTRRLVKALTATVRGKNPS